MNESEIDAALQSAIDELMLDAEKGDLEAMYHASLLLHGRAMAKLSWELFNKAEELLFNSAGGGYQEAIDSLEDWETLKYVFDRRVQRRAQT